MKKYFLVLIGLLIVSGSCVSKKKYDELQERYNTDHATLSDLQEENDSLRNISNKFGHDLQTCRDELARLKKDYQTQQQLYASMESAYKNLQASYDALSKKSSAALEAQSIKTRELLRDLDIKQKKLAEEKEKLERMRAELDARSARITELENLIKQKEALLNRVKQSLSASLDEFKQQGLRVHMKDGKLYVSMQNKLLFDSGSWKLKGRGTSAIRKIAKVLAENPDIEIMIEGHTDSVPYHGNQYITDNWDLSVKRATTVVREILRNKNIDPKRLIAAGRSKYLPVAPNDTPQHRALNRRIEVILTPNMEKINRLLNQAAREDQTE